VSLNSTLKKDNKIPAVFKPAIMITIAILK